MAQTPAYTKAQSRRDQRLPVDQHEMRGQRDGSFSCRVIGCPVTNVTLAEAIEHTTKNQFRA